jgi:predicted methyltransferase
MLLARGRQLTCPRSSNTIKKGITMQKQKRLAHHVAQAVLALSACGLFGIAAAADSPYQAAISSPARAADSKDDAKRKPAQFLEFAQVKPGMKVLDIVAGGGATSQLIALAVGPSGEVWAQNAKANPNLEKRLAATPQANLHPVVLGFDNPVPAGAPALDLVTIIMNYHDIVNTPTDRASMNKRLFDAVKPGGHVVIIDNAAKDGSGISATQTLHRIDEAAVVAELTAAGFALDAKSDYLRVPSDSRELPFFKMDGKPDDKFVVRFVKK